MPKTTHQTINRTLLVTAGLLAGGIAMGQGSYPGGPGEQPNCHTECWDITNNSNAGVCCWDDDEFSCDYSVKSCDANLWTKVPGTQCGRIGNGEPYQRTCTRCDAVDTGGGNCVPQEPCTENVVHTWPTPTCALPCRSCDLN